VRPLLPKTTDTIYVSTQPDRVDLLGSGAFSAPHYSFIKEKHAGTFVTLCRHPNDEVNPKASEACAPRLQADLKQYNNVVYLPPVPKDDGLIPLWRTKVTNVSITVPQWRYVVNTPMFDAPKVLVFDTETVGLYGELLAAAFGDPDSGVVYIYTKDYGVPPLSPDTVLVAHNAKYDLRILPQLQEMFFHNGWDTMLMQYQLSENARTYALKELGKWYFGIEDWKEEHIADLRKISTDQLYRYVTRDICVTYALWALLKKEMQAHDLKALALLREATVTLAKVETLGFGLDGDQIKMLLHKFDSETREQVKFMRRIANMQAFNPRSPQQVADVLYDELGLPDPKLFDSKQKKPLIEATNDDTLAVLEAQDTTGFVKALKAHRRISKLVSSYVEPLAEFGNRVHPSFLMHRTETGRLAATNPAIQTIPRPDDEYGAWIRSSFVPADGYTFVECDFSQAELRVAGALSKEPFLIDVYDRDADLHSEVAKSIFGPGFTKAQRVICKTINFGWLYGASAGVIAKQAHIPFSEANDIVRRYEKNMPVLLRWKEQLFRQAKEVGFIETPFGRRRRFGPNEDEKDVRKACVNAPVQSTASDLTLKAAIQLVRQGYRVVLLVHDSILIEAPNDTAEAVGIHASTVMAAQGMQYLPNVKWKADYEIKSRWCKRPEVKA
jgi:DNA polymerase I